MLKSEVYHSFYFYSLKEIVFLLIIINAEKNNKCNKSTEKIIFVSWNNWLTVYSRKLKSYSLSSKVLAKMILNRINTKLDELIPKEQAGFHSGPSCIDQINTLRIIIEQMHEMNSLLHLVCMDHEKAFDRVSPQRRY